MNRHDRPLAIIIGGDTPTRAMLRFLLEDDGCVVAEAGDIEAVTAIPRAEDAALFALITGDHDRDAAGLLGRLRRHNPAVPIVVLAHTSSLDLRRRVFALGARDVVGLPVAAHDLQVRLRAVLGAQLPYDAASDPATVVRAGGLTLRTLACQVGDEEDWSAALTRRETALLQRLMLSPGQVVEHHELLESIWPEQGAGTANALAVLVGRLRAKLAHPTVPHGYIRTAHGRGYSFDARSAPRLEQDVARPAGLQVLVVEDDRSTVEMIIEILRMAGYNVTSGVGPDAPALARQVQPHVILLDINMPGMDGVEVRRRLRGSPGTAGIPVIALSAAHNLRLRAGEMGADDYLTKPFSTDELLLRIARWVGRAPASDVASDGGTTPVTPAPGAASPAR